MFFIDEGAETGALGADDAAADADDASGAAIMPESYATADNQIKAAWEDSDDERISVSLASQPRLRKLRVREGEDVVSGVEYCRRLRWQFERLNPRPEWALQAPATEKKKKSKKTKRIRVEGEQILGEDGSDGGESSESEIESGSDSESDISAAPNSTALAKLLQCSTLLRDASARKRRKIGPEVIDIHRMKGVFADSAEGPGAITNLAFHPRLPLLLSSGPHGVVYLNHVNGAAHTPSPHPLLVSMQLKSVAITSSAFFPPLTGVGESTSTSAVDGRDQGRIVLSGRRKYFHVWNMTTGDIARVTRLQGHEHEQRSMEHAVPSPCGRYLALRGSSRKGRSGVVNILDGQTMQWHSQVRIDSVHGVRDFAWWADGCGLVVLGANGELTEWHVERGCAVATWRDQGAFGASVVRLSGPARTSGSKPDSARLGGDRWIAIGANTGIVTIYDRRQWHVPIKSTTSGDVDMADDDDTAIPGVAIPRNPVPVRTVENLVTPITHLAFSPPDGYGNQVLAMASHSKRDAFKLVHLPTGTVYRNWPTSETPLGRVSAVAFGIVRSDGDIEATTPGEDSLVMAVANDRGRVNMWEIR